MGTAANEIDFDALNPEATGISRERPTFHEIIIIVPWLGLNGYGRATARWRDDVPVWWISRSPDGYGVYKVVGEIRRQGVSPVSHCAVAQRSRSNVLRFRRVLRRTLQPEWPSTALMCLERTP